MGFNVYETGDARMKEWLQLIEEFAATLEVLNEGASFSETIRELRESLLDGIFKRDETYLSKKKVQEAKSHLSDQDLTSENHEKNTPILDIKAPEKAEMVRGINQMVRQVAEVLEKHTWSQHLVDNLGDVEVTGEPFREQPLDAFQVRQVKKLINALYHLELGLKVIESPELKGPLHYYATLTKDVKSTIWYLLPNLWSTMTNVSSKSLQIVEHIYRACELLTQIEPEILDSFSFEWSYISRFLDIKHLAEQYNHVESAFKKQQMNDILTKMGYLQGVLLDQLRPNKTGGANLVLLFQLATSFSQVLFEEEAGGVQAFLAEPDKAFSNIKSWLIHNGVEPTVLAEAEHVIHDEITLWPDEEKAHFKALKQSFEQLEKAVTRLNNAERSFSSLEMVQYLYIAWYAYSLLSKMTREVSSLSDSSQQFVYTKLIDLRDTLFAGLVGQYDKLEETALMTTGALTRPLIIQLESIFNTIVSKISFIDPIILGPFQSKAFCKKRLDMAKSRYQYVEDQWNEVDTILIPAVDLLISANLGAEAHQRRFAAFQALQPHLEAIDAQWSDALIQNWPKDGVSPVIPPVKYRRYIEALLERLQSLEKTKAFAMAQIKDCMKSIDPQYRPVYHTSKKVLQDLPPCEFRDLKPPSKRKMQGYLIEDNTEQSTIKKTEHLLDDMRQKIEQYVIDPHGNQSSALSLKHVTSALDDLKSAIITLQSINRKDYQVNYVYQTISFFDKTVQAFTKLYPYGMALRSAYQQGVSVINSAYESQTKHYQLPKSSQLADIVYSAMHAACVVPEHLKAMVKGQPNLTLESQKRAVDAANLFANEVHVINEHMNIEWSFFRYPALGYDALRILVKRLMGHNTIDKQAIDTLNRLFGSIYHTMIQHGLQGLNEHAFYELQCVADDTERALNLNPGTLSLPLEGLIDNYVKAFLEPLSVPSNIYFKVRVNQASYDKRIARLPADCSHARFLRQRLTADDLMTKRKKMAREEAIDRVLDLELMRLKQAKSFSLKFADKLYFSALRNTIRPHLQAMCLGEGGFEERVFDVMYKEPTTALYLLDESKGSCRLDAINTYISKLEDYLKPTYEEAHPLLFYVFENKKTYQAKRAWVKKLRSLCNDTNRLPSQRFSEIKALLQDEACQLALNPPLLWYSFANLVRIVLWCLSWLGISNFQIAGDVALDGLLQAADLSVVELQVFDSLYARDYRQLDAILKQITLLENYLQAKNNTPNYLKSLYETQNTIAIKKCWLAQLRQIAEDTEKSPQERIVAMYALMSKPDFKTDLLTYATVDSWYTFQAFQRGVLWLCACVGLYTLPCVGEYQELIRAANPKTRYADKPLISCGLFNKSVSSTERNYTAESALTKLGLISAA